MARSRLWLIGGAIAAVLVLVLGWFFFVSPQRDEADQLTQQAADLEQQNQLLAAKIAQLKQQASALPSLQAELDTLAAQAPPTPEIPELVRQLSSVASETGVTLLSVAPALPAPWTPPAATATPTATGTAAASGAPAAPGAPAAGAANGIQQIALTVAASGAYSNVQLFISRLETLPRALLVSGWTLGRGAEGGATGGNTLALSLQGSVFILPDLPTAVPTITPPADAGTGASAGTPGFATDTASPAPTESGLATASVTGSESVPTSAPTPASS